MRIAICILLAAAALSSLSCSRAAGDWVLDEKGMEDSLARIFATAAEPLLHLGEDGQYILMVRRAILATGKWERKGERITLHGFGEAAFRDDRVYLVFEDRHVVLKRK